MCKIVIAGDILPSKSNDSLFVAGDGESLFDDKVLRIFKSADFSIVNLEGPLTNAQIKQDKVGPVLKASPDSVKGLQSLGVSCVALANNHFTDYLKAGCEDTINSLDKAGIHHIGGGIDRQSVNTNISVFLGKEKVCIYNVSETFFNVPSESSPGVNVYDEYLVCNEIKELKKNHDYLIVLYHGGSEMCPYPTPVVRKRFRRMADCGADFITAQHTHCIGCEEKYKNSYLLYGQGNFYLDHMKQPIARQGLITQITFTEDSIGIEHFRVSISEGKLIIDPEQELRDFKKRTEEILDESLAEERYYEYIRSAGILKSRYYEAFKGGFIGKGVLKKFFPHLLLSYIEKNYGPKDLDRIVFSLESDRMREDVLSLWKQLKEKRS